MVALLILPSARRQHRLTLLPSTNPRSDDSRRSVAPSAARGREQKGGCKNVPLELELLRSTDMSKKAKARLCDLEFWPPLAAGASSRNLAAAFLTCL